MSLGDRVEEARLSSARLFRLVPAADQLLILTDDLRLVRDKQVVGRFEPPILLLEQFRLRFPDVQRRHPHLDQAGCDQQCDSIEYAIDEQGFTQLERADRSLQRIGEERHERERHRQSPEQSPIAGEGRQHERDTVNRCNVELHPCGEIEDDFKHREHDCGGVCEGNGSVRNRNAGNRLRFAVRNHFCS